MLGNFLKAFAACVIVSLLTAAPATAALLAYEGFDYAEGGLGAANGGSGWDAAWDGGTDPDYANAGVVIGSLVSPVPHLSSTGNSLDVTGQGFRFKRDLTSQGFGADNTTIYMSFLAAFKGGGNNNAAVELIRGSNTDIATFGGDTNGTANFGVNDKQGAENDIAIPGTTDSQPADNDTHLWVLQMDFGAGNVDSITLTYDGSLIGTQEFGNLAFTDLGMLFFSGTEGALVDEIRIGESLEDVSLVVPEPASACLAILAGLFACGRRSRS